MKRSRFVLFVLLFVLGSGWIPHLRADDYGEVASYYVENPDGSIEVIGLASLYLSYNTRYYYNATLLANLVQWEPFLDLGYQHAYYYEINPNVTLEFSAMGEPGKTYITVGDYSLDVVFYDYGYYYDYCDYERYDFSPGYGSEWCWIYQLGGWIVLSQLVTGHLEDEVTIPVVIRSISPNRGLVGTAVSVTISGQGLGTSPSVQVSGSGVTASVDSASATSITSTFSIAANAAGGNRNVTVTSGGQTSNSVTFLVRVPTSFQKHGSVEPTDLDCDPGSNGFGVSVTYQVADQQGDPIERGDMTPQEHFTVNGQEAFPGFRPFAFGTTTNSSGRFVDIPVGTCYSTTVGNPCVNVVQTFNILVPTSGGGSATFPISTQTTRRDCRLGIRVEIRNGTDVDTTTLGTVN